MALSNLINPELLEQLSFDLHLSHPIIPPPPNSSVTESLLATAFSRVLQTICHLLTHAMDLLSGPR
jgi:hypothetical protein